MIGHPAKPVGELAGQLGGQLAGTLTLQSTSIKVCCLPLRQCSELRSHPAKMLEALGVAGDLGNRVNPGPLSLALVDGVDGEGNEGCPSEQPDGQPDASCITITSIIRVALGCTPLASSAGLRVNLIADVFTELRGAKLLADGRCAQESCEQLHPARTTDHPNHEPLDVCNQFSSFFSFFLG